MTNFDANSTTDDVIKGNDLSGKVAVVTGASAGLGVETSRTLAAAGAEVVMLGRDVSKLEQAAQEIKSAHPEVTLHTIGMDLADLDSVRAAAAQVLALHSKIDLLINNAGIMACSYGLTNFGYELQFGTNHVGHFLFTCLLVPAVVQAAPARIINLSSGGHKICDIDLDDINYESRPYEKWAAYGQSKTANVLFSVALSNRLLEKGVQVFAVHPGTIRTELRRYLDGDGDTASLSTSKSAYNNRKTIPGGAATSVWAATSADLEGKSGIYLEDCQIAKPAIPDQLGGFNAYAIDPDKAEKLWTLTEQIVTQEFSF
jgi:NAD(P)-dependent dehydrogenase (short-subunit alcohol dehydrogenase family)